MGSALPHPPCPPRGLNNRSISFQVASRNLASPSASSHTPAISSTQHSHPDSISSAFQCSQSTAQGPLPSSSSTRSRPRSQSVGAGSQSGIDSSDESALSPLALAGQKLDRGPGTPDFVLGSSSQSWSRSRQSKGKGRLEEVRNGALDPYNDRNDSSPSSSSSTKSGKRPLASSLPRLTTRLRSFLTTFTAVQEEEGRAVAADHPRDLSLLSTSNLSNSNSSLRTRTADNEDILVVPFARPAGMTPFGSLGLNDDSPPLTPSSSTDDRFLSQPWNSSLSSSLTTSTAPTSRTESPTLHDGEVGRVSLKGPRSLGTGGDILAKNTAAPAPLAYDPLHIWPRLPSLSPSLLATQAGNLLRAGLHSRTLRHNMPTLLMLLTFFVSATLVVFLLLTTLPLRMPSHGLTQLSLAEIRDICLSLRDYATSTPRAYHHTLFVLCLFYTYKQAFNIPGSIISNVVFGALFGIWKATFWLSIFTAVGGSGAAVMSALVAPLVLKIPGMHNAVAVLRKTLGSKNLGRVGGRTTALASHPMRRTSLNVSRSGTPKLAHRAQSPHPSHKHKTPHSGPPSVNGRGNLFSILLLLRLLPFTPYGVMNIACGILNVPLLPFGATLAMGSVPWNAVTAQLGEILVEVVAAIPDDSAFGEDLSAGGSGVTLGEQLDTGGFHDAPLPLSHGISPASSKSHLLSSAAHKAGGGIKALVAKIWTREMILKLIGLSLLSITPVLLGRWWKARQARIAKMARKGRKHTISHSSGNQQLSQEQEQEWPHSQIETPTSAYGGLYVHGPQAGRPAPSAAAVLDWSEGEEDEGMASSASEYEYDSPDEYTAENEDALVSPSGSSILNKSPLGKGSSILSAASLAAESGPALIAQLTRSASRNSWNRGTAAWFGSSVDRSRSRSPGQTTPAAVLDESGEETSPGTWKRGIGEGWAAFSAQGEKHNYTPQLEAQNPFEPQRQQEQYRRSIDESAGRQQEQDRGWGGPFETALPSASVHPWAMEDGPNTCTSGGHCRRGSAPALVVGGEKREPRRLTAVVR